MENVKLHVKPFGLFKSPSTLSQKPGTVVQLKLFEYSDVLNVHVLKGKYHINLMSFQNPKMFDCLSTETKK